MPPEEKLPAAFIRPGGLRGDSALPMAGASYVIP